MNVESYAVTFTNVDKGCAGGTAHGYRVGGGALSQTVVKDHALVWPTVSGRPGWLFAGWHEAQGNDGLIEGARSADQKFVTGDLTFEASYTQAVYQVVYANLQGAENPIANPTAFTVDKAYAPSGERELKGQLAFQWPADRKDSKDNPIRFLGWKPAVLPAGTTSNFVANALWEATEEAEATNVYTVTYDLSPNGHVAGTDGLTVTNVRVSSGKNAVTPVVEADPGWQFVGWDSSADEVTADCTVKARYAILSYAILYANTMNVSHDNQLTYTCEDEFSLHALKNSDDRVSFLGWSPTNGVARGTSGDLTFTALWAHLVTYTLGDHMAFAENPASVDSRKQYVAEGGSTNALAVTTDPGYAFAGWYDADGRLQYDADGNPAAEESRCVSAAQSLTGVATAVVYRISYDNLQGATHANTNAYTVEDAIVFAPPGARDGFSFTGWVPPEIAKGTTGDVTVVATWTNRFTATFTIGEHLHHTGGGELEQTVGPGEPALAPTVEADAGYLFAGWYDTNGAHVDAESLRVITEDLNLHAVATAQVYAITYENLQGATHTNTTAYTVEITKPIVFADPSVREGYVFRCWSPSAIEVGSTGDVTVVAAWESETYPIAYTNLCGATHSNATNYNAGDTRLFTAPTSREGYRFLGWSPPGIDAKTRGPVLAEASWQRVRTLTYTLGEHLAFADGALASTNTFTETVDDGASTNAPAVTADAGYLFAGWYDANGAPVDAESLRVITEDQNLHAVATAQVYAITYENLQGATHANTNAYTIEDAIVFAPPRARDGFSFTGWEPPEIAKGTTGDVTVVAAWTNLFTATFTLDDHLDRTGGGELVQKVAFGESAVPPTVEADDGYSFAGWYDANGNPVESFRVTADTVFCGRYAAEWPYVSVTVAEDSLGRGTVSGGNKSVKSGTKLTLKATPAKDCVFAAWYLATPSTSNSQTSKLSNSQTSDFLSQSPAYTITVGTRDSAYEARFISKSEDWATVSCGEIAGENATSVAIEPIAVVAAGGSLPTVRVTGLPTGLKFTAKDVVTKVTTGSGSSKVTTYVTNAPANTIYGKPTKSGVYTATLTATTAGGAKATTNVTFVIVNRAKGECVVRTSVTLKGASPEEQAGLVPGTVKGAGAYQPGKKVTLRATAARGCVFSGWYVAETDSTAAESNRLMSSAASYSFTMPADDIALTAAFVMAEDDAASIRASVAGLTLAADGEAVAAATNVTAGVYLAWPVAASAESAVTVKVSGLPTGLKFTAKPVTTKVSTGAGASRVTTVVTNVPAMTIYGAPTAASKTDRGGNVTPAEVKVTVTTAGKNKVVSTLSLTVDALPTWLVSTYAGGATNRVDGAGEGEEIEGGAASATVAATGKISGKWISDGQTWTLAATSFAEGDARNAESRFTATVTAKCGKESEEMSLVFAPVTIAEGNTHEETTIGTLQTSNFKLQTSNFQTSNSQTSNSQTSNFQTFTPLFTARGANWKAEPWKSLANEMKGAKFALASDDLVRWSDEDGDAAQVIGQVGANGTASVKATFAIDARTLSVSPTGTTTYSATASGTLEPLGDDRFELILHYPPKANKFDGETIRLVLRWTGSAFLPASPTL